jgi:hypothetical protein
VIKILPQLLQLHGLLLNGSIILHYCLYVTLDFETPSYNSQPQHRFSSVLSRYHVPFKYHPQMKLPLEPSSSIARCKARHVWSSIHFFSTLSLVGPVLAHVRCPSSLFSTKAVSILHDQLRYIGGPLSFRSKRR